MAYDLAKVTANGNNLIAQILANKSSLSIDKIEISDTQLSSTTDISTMTSVPKVVQTVSANGFSKNSNTLIISTVVDNSSIRADYKAWVFGIWGSDSQNGQSQLIAVITSTNSPDTIPAFSGRTPVSYTYKFNIGFSNASQIKFKMINGSFATNDTVVHTTGDETINGQKKFDTDPTDGSGNAYAKTVDVNQQLDKKVNVADMRKPASDVVGLEDVSTSVYRSDLAKNTDLNTLTQEGIYNFETSLVNFIDSNTHWGTIQVINKSAVVSQYVICTTINIGPQIFFRTQSDYPANWDIWKMVPEFGMDDSLSLELPNGELLKPADDSKVAHLSGANNFDTIPTVDNNPLLLASSLPSDLARTGQAQTFTAPQTFSIAPVINDASKDKGDNQAATMADLKSVENSAWHTVTLPDSQGLKSITMIYKNHEDEKYIEANIYAQSIYGGPYGCIMLDLSGIVHSITDIDLAFTSIIGNAFLYDNPSGTAEARAVGAKISLQSNCEIYGQTTNIGTISEKGGSFAKIYYDSLVNN
ncbi:pyocin knob domain-containing protein [Lentilactobacillus kefiri]|uniref:pyocin knob domain-containing protein n=1 Tax=Lentilactobacillus kefiri TaxID=33962 RepID=UPI0025A1DA7C|nr:pyocin knob domain-containing protein [Lentilactobacillus kefiri]MDM7493148.1 pyocin knob domain-containing protein [Lentilactobacillus kefiri]